MIQINFLLLQPSHLRGYCESTQKGIKFPDCAKVRATR